MLQNRVNPWGELCKAPYRGTLMGNRGILHDANRDIVKQWAHQSWVCCVLEFKGIRRPRPFSTTNNYSELFFLDEATAFAAGHRPCSFCQRERAQLFKSEWFAANPGPTGQTSMKALDAVLHSDRVDRSRVKVTFKAAFNGLPQGTMFVWNGVPHLRTSSGCVKWTFGGYEPCAEVPDGQDVEVLTPRSVVNAFSRGFVPNIHPSASMKASV
jgi:hypothetical protein